MPLSASDNEATLWLRLALNNPDIDHAQAGIKQIEESLAGVEKHAGASSQAVATAIAPAQAAAQAAATQNLKDLKRLETQANRTQSEWRRLQFASRSMGEVFTIIGAAAGAVFLGGLAWASKYVASVKESTATVQEWRLGLDSLKTSQDRVGAVLADALLPLLEKAASLAGKVVTFVEANPQVIRAALNTAGAVLALSAIGIAATKGFKIYADIGYTLATAKQVAASAAMEAAAAQQVIAGQEMVVAANIMATGVPAAGAAGAGLAGAAGTVGGTGALAVGTAAIAQGYRLNSAGQLINSATGRYASVSQGMEANVGTEGLGGLGGGGFLGFLKSLPLYFFGAMKDTFTEIEMAQKEANAQALLDTTGVGDSWEKQGGWPGFWDKLMGITKPYAGAIDVTTGQRVTTYGGVAAPGTAGGAPAGPTPGSAAYVDLFMKQQLPMFEEYEKQKTSVTDSYNKQRLSLDTTYERQRTDTVANYNKQRASLEADYSKSTSREMRDFTLSESQAWEDYYSRRSGEAATFGEESLRAEQDHQREMRKLLEDHNDKVEGFAATRDALGYAREMRDYERKRRDAEEEYATNQGRRNKDYARAMYDMELQFRKERARTIAAYRQRSADQAQDHKEQMDQMAVENAETLSRLESDYLDQKTELEKTYNDALTTLSKALRDRINDLDVSILGDYVYVHNKIAEETIRFRTWLAGMAASLAAGYGGSGGGGNKLKAAGGYAGFGSYTLGEEGREFVLSNMSTRLAERVVGGQLSQHRLISAMLNMGGGGGYVDNRKMEFNGMTAADRDWVRSMIVRISEQTVVNASRA
jgi:hypothetical protein